MKRLIFNFTVIVLMVIAFSFIGLGQAGGTGGNDDNAIHATASYLRRDIPLEIPTGATFYRDAIKDSIGFEIGYTHFLGGDNKTGKNGWFGIGVEGGYSFSNVGDSRVNFGYGRGAVSMQRRGKGHVFRPFVKGYVGLAGQDFGPANRFGNSPDGGLVIGGPERSLYLGGSAGVDWKIAKKVSLRLPEVDLGRTTFGPEAQWNAQVKAGLVFDF